MADDETSSGSKTEPRLGSYRLIRQLGSGGMSSVYYARHAETDTEVAVKVLPRTLAKSSTLLQRFFREAKSAEALQHPNIVSIFDRGTDGGRHYLVLEYIDGGDLHDRVRNGGPLRPAEAIETIRQVALGLRYAAEMGVIHRDIKPANLLQASDGTVKIIDLGLALQSEGEDERVTRDGTTVGTVDYMSPEQARDSRATTVRSDIYSLGCTLYYLLTGSPPYPGGSISDKLSRHCTAPPPDARDVRPEIPDGIALLARRMMAKRPEKRFVDYDELLAAIEALSSGSGPGAKARVPLDVLIDEDDDDFLVDDRPSSGLTSTRPPSTRERARASSGEGFTVADLAEIEATEPGPRTARAPKAAASTAARATPLLDAVLADDSEEDLPIESFAAAGSMPRRMSDAETNRWLKTLIGVGVGMILFVIIGHQVFLATVGETENAASEPIPGAAGAATKSSSGDEDLSLVNIRTSPSALLKKPASKSRPQGKNASKPTQGWIEPADVEEPKVAEAAFPTEVADRVLPAWSRLDPSVALAAGLAAPVTLTRIVDASVAGQVPNPRRAFEQPNAVLTEVDDDGPFFESDPRLVGESKWVRARPGRRPILQVTAPRIDAVRARPGVFVLDGKQLVLEGLDLVVDLKDLPREQTSIFACRGGTLVLRRCTVTVIEAPSRTLSLVSVEPSSKPSRVVLERTLVRARSLTLFDFAGGSADVSMSRSVVLNGQGALFETRGGDATATRRIAIERCLIAGRESLFRFRLPAAAGTASVVRALGTTFVRIAAGSGDEKAGLMSSVDEADPARLVDWLGDYNLYSGWDSFFAPAASAGRVRLAGLDEARSTWRGSDVQSLSRMTRWPAATRPERATPRELLSLAREQEATIARVAAPSPWIEQKTYLMFDRPPIPEIAVVDATTAAGPAVGVRLMMPKVDSGGNPLGSAPPGSTSIFAGKNQKNLGTPKAGDAKSASGAGTPDGVEVFDVAAAPWKGDLGLFLREKAVPGVKSIHVRVLGSGTHPFTPFKAPEGVSIAIEAAVPALGGGALVGWSPNIGSTSDQDAEDALIEVRGGDLMLRSVQLGRGATPQPKWLVRVVDGCLAIDRCRLIATSSGPGAAGGLIAFEAPGSKPFQRGAGLFKTAVNRPVCRIVDSVLISGGDVLALELGRGLAALTHCAIAAGNSAFTIRPGKTSRTRFEADLSLERCTVVAERDFFRGAAWPGSDPGPDRPWLISSRQCAYLDGYDRPARQSVLLRVAPGTLEPGAIFWQGQGDAYELAHFQARGDQPPVTRQWPDFRRLWTDFWGPEHVRNSTGPTGPSSSPAVRLVARPRPGEVLPDELVLDATHHPGRTTLDVGADPKRLGIGGPKAARRR